jgi:uncharacterized protein YkwD
MTFLRRARARRRGLGHLAALLALTVALVSACLPLEPDEMYLYDRTNELRAQHGLPALLVHDELTVRAQQVADDLAARRVLQHSDLRQLGFAYNTAGENLGRGTSIETITQRLFDSPSHRANALSPWYGSQSVGIARGGDGLIYVVHLFSG